MKCESVVQCELDDLSLKVQGMEQKVAEEANKIVTQAIMKTRVEMMLEYHRGEWSTWDVAETNRIYSETCPDDAFLVDCLDDDDVVQESPKDKALGDDQ